jgi:hypothetical protein
VRFWKNLKTCFLRILNLKCLTTKNKVVRPASIAGIA